MARRLYLGKLPTDVRSEDVTKFFEGVGRVVDCRVMTALSFNSQRKVVAREGTIMKTDGNSSMSMIFSDEVLMLKYLFPSARSRRPPGVRIVVSGLSRDTSWQDLKDFGRDAGTVSFADIDRDVPGQGLVFLKGFIKALLITGSRVLEYPHREDAERAVKQLDGTDLRGRPVRVALDDGARSGPDNYRRDDRRDDRYGRDDRYSRRDDRYREREDRAEFRRDRSRSPRRGGDFDDRRRSPPPRRDDDRRPSGYDDRRGGDDDRKRPDYYDRRRDEDRRRDDKRREEKDDRYDDRPRHANGEGYR
ncbi:hypothetical protein VNI00_009522 [Paramarasmius palmivorus]|uniref:RRM domain-containing protein n=1 Tax=Paramarasmius palmivorus TaxID=297713 RepID=A0AAW0CPA8_9AGAR